MNFLVSVCLTAVSMRYFRAHLARLNNLPESNANVKVIQNCILPPFDVATVVLVVVVVVFVVVVAVVVSVSFVC